MMTLIASYALDAVQETTEHERREKCAKAAIARQHEASAVNNQAELTPRDSNSITQLYRRHKYATNTFQTMQADKDAAALEQLRKILHARRACSDAYLKQIRQEDAPLKAASTAQDAKPHKSYAPLLISLGASLVVDASVYFYNKKMSYVQNPNDNPIQDFWKIDKANTECFIRMGLLMSKDTALAMHGMIFRNDMMHYISHLSMIWAKLWLLNITSLKSLMEKKAVIALKYILNEYQSTQKTITESGSTPELENQRVEYSKEYAKILATMPSENLTKKFNLPAKLKAKFLSNETYSDEQTAA